MIIIGGLPTGVVFGPHGITPSQIARGGNELSPLANDVDAGDDATNILWRLEAPYLGLGVTSVTDAGIYQLDRAPSGVHTQTYRLFSLPASGAATTSLTSIVTTVGPFIDLPVIIQAPLGMTVLQGSSAAFTASATGSPPLTFQWQRNGSDIPNATASSYTLPNALLTDSGVLFRVVATNSFGSTTSVGALLLVTPIPSPSPVVIGVSILDGALILI